jgi:threonyl-tRNA synthetase
MANSRTKGAACLRVKLFDVKIQRAEQMKVHTMFVIGKRDMDADAVSVRVHGKGNLGAKLREEAVAEILAAIKNRAPQH